MFIPFIPLIYQNKTMKNPNVRNPEDFVTQTEAEQITRLKRTQLYKYRMSGSIYWTTGLTRQVLYYKPDLLSLIGLN